MKRIISVLLLCAMLAVSLFACAEKPITKQVTVEGAVFGGKNDDKISAEVVFDRKWITSDENCTYNPDLAKFCALLSADSYFREKDYAKGRQNRVLFADSEEADYDRTVFLHNVGFTEAEVFESYLIQDTTIDTNDSVTLTLGHTTVDGKYDAYAVVIRGCFSWQEWCSAFDPGCKDAAYEEMTGAHPGWTNKDHFKGIDVAANCALDYIKHYMDTHNDESLPDCILITGHSRGGTIANFLGAYFEKETDVRSYTYTFNSMPASCSDNADGYKTIFNIFDSGDFFVDPFPFENSNFRRYGTDMTLTGADNAEFRSALSSMKGRDDYLCVSSETAAEYRSLFAQRFQNRDMLCETQSITRVYDTEDAAAARQEEWRTLTGTENGLGLDDLCTVGEIVKTDDGKYTLSVEYCGLTLLRAYAKILAYGESAYSPVVNLFAEDESGCRIASLLFENAAEINGGHLIINSYILAGMLK